MSVDLFAPVKPDEVAGDRARVARFLQAYLRTGVVGALPEIRTGPAMRMGGNRNPLEQCSWKWSELYGKYVGCQYWSESAAESMRAVAAELPNKSRRSLSRMAAKRDRGSIQLQHDHVFPRKEWAAMMQPDLRVEWELDELIDQLDRYCVGCVITRREHEELPRAEGVKSNPWLRYRGSSIALVPNPGWPALHHRWITEAGLVS